MARIHCTEGGTQHAGIQHSMIFLYYAEHAENRIIIIIIIMVYSGFAKCLTTTGTHMPYGITQCYLPPGRVDVPAITPAEAGTRFSDPGGMQG